MGRTISTPPPELSPLEEKKLARELAVASITVTTTSGKTFDGDEKSQERMARAITVGTLTGQVETVWVLADNTPAIVTIAEMAEALALSMQRMGELWLMPYEDEP